MNTEKSKATERILNFKLSIVEVNTILNVLEEQPWKYSNSLIHHIKKNAELQLEKINASSVSKKEVAVADIPV